MNGPLSGLLVPALTPFSADLSTEKNRYARYCNNLLERGADGIAMLGTTGEANSMTSEERKGLPGDFWTSNT